MQDNKRRAVAELTDDEIVDAIAAFGIGGMDIEDPYECSSFEWFMCRLELIGPDDVLDDETTGPIEGELSNRVGEMPERIDTESNAGARWFITPKEWGRRLEGKRRDEIAAILQGGAE